MARPNVVLFMPDQLRADALGCFGNTAASTPNFDALAARGLRFENAFCQHPVCGPSRVSVMTVTVAPASGAPVTSVTSPEMDEAGDCVVATTRAKMRPIMAWGVR